MDEDLKFQAEKSRRKGLHESFHSIEQVHVNELFQLISRTCLAFIFQQLLQYLHVCLHKNDLESIKRLNGLYFEFSLSSRFILF